MNENPGMPDVVERIETGMIVCTAGTKTNPLIKSLGLPLERGRLVTSPEMKVKGSANLWALGDCALVIPFPPNIVQLRRSQRQPAESEAAESLHPEHQHEYQS